MADHLRDEAEDEAPDSTRTTEEREAAHEDEGAPESDRGRARDASTGGREAETLAAGYGRRRLSFASRYPESAALDALLDAFDRGDFGHVRLAAPKLARSTDDPAVAKAARDLASRLEPDPLAIRMLAGAAILLSFLTYWFYSNHP